MLKGYKLCLLVIELQGLSSHITLYKPQLHTTNTMSNNVVKTCETIDQSLFTQKIIKHRQMISTEVFNQSLTEFFSHATAAISYIL